MIVAGTGNEGAGAGHTGGLLEMGREQAIELSVSAFENSFGVQLWKSYADIFSISLRSPQVLLWELTGKSGETAF